MQQNIQAYIDAYSNFILNHLLLAENPTGINIIQLAEVPQVHTLPSTPGGLLYKNLDYLFKNYTPIKLGNLSLASSYEISLYFLCTEPKFNIVSADVFFETYYQLTSTDYLIMTLHSHDTPVTTSKLEASSLITCSLNLSLQHDYDLYKKAVELIRKMVIRFYSPILNRESNTPQENTLTKSSQHPPTPPIDEHIIEEQDPQSLLSSEELDALSHIFDNVDSMPDPH